MSNSTSLSPVPVLTARGSRMPKMGTLAYHPSIGFAEVVGRVGERVRIAVTDFSDATDVVVNAGKKNEAILSRKHWLKRVADASDNSALIECAVYDARAKDETDALYGASALVRQLQESVMSRCRRANELLVSIDGAEAIGWEFDEYATYIPKRKITKGKAPAPRPQPKPVSRVGTLEDPSRPDWLVAEMNECFGDMWTPNAEA
tara:strand:+ start:224 stop:835 length:612 start_codon:yes stop_codon:yes gene_type:complete